MWAVIRIRGNAGRRKNVLRTFEMLRLNKPMHCVVLKENVVNKGMIMKIKDWSTWGIISEETLKKMITKRGRMGRNKLTEEQIEKAFNDYKAGNKVEITPVFRLNPPSKGFRKSVKQHFPNGELGKREEKINELLLRMI